jgi:hypothetical protein
VEMDIRHDRHLAGADNLFQRSRALHIGTGYANNIDARFFTAADLVDCRLGGRWSACWSSSAR